MLRGAAPASKLHMLPELGGLEVRGHVPDLSARSELLAELSSELGNVFPLSDQIKVLPNPQCAALGLIETLGLPQSTDQFTNTRVIGPDAQARIYTYTAGQRLLFDVQAPDYNAVIYVDYFRRRRTGHTSCSEQF